MGKVTDPALLAALDGPAGPVSDPDILAALEGPKLGMGDVQAAPSAQPPQPPGLLKRAGQFIGSMVLPVKHSPGALLLSKLTGGRSDEFNGEGGLYAAGLPASPPREPGESAKDYALRSFRPSLGTVDDVMPLLGMTLPGGGNVGLQRAPDALERIAIDKGRKVLTGNTAPLGTRKPLSDAAVLAAYEQGAIRPLGTVEKAAAKLQGAREVLGQQYADVVAALEAKGVTGPDATKLAVEILDEAKKSAANSLGSPRPGMFEAIADELGTKPVDAQGRLGLTQAESMKRTLQRGARADYLKEGPESLAGEARIDLASKLRQAVEDEVAAQASKAPAEAAAFVPVKEKLGPVIEASNAANRGAARAANRQTHGLGSKVMAAGALATGNVPAAGATLLASTALRNRGPATAGWTAKKLADALRKLERPSGAATGSGLGQALRLRLQQAAAEDDDQ